MHKISRTYQASRFTIEDGGDLNRDLTTSESATVKLTTAQQGELFLAGKTEYVPPTMIQPLAFPQNIVWRKVYKGGQLITGDRNDYYVSTADRAVYEVLDEWNGESRAIIAPIFEGGILGSSSRISDKDRFVGERIRVVGERFNFVILYEETALIRDDKRVLVPEGTVIFRDDPDDPYGYSDETLLTFLTRFVPIRYSAEAAPEED